MIDFDEPLPFFEAAEKLSELGLMPTSLSSAEIRDTLDAELLERSIFSARTTKAEILDGYKKQLRKLLDGKVTGAEARADMQAMYRALKYRPETGFEGDEDLGIPPAEAGELRDLSGDERIDLVLRTNVSHVANWGFREQGQSEFSLYTYPCYELIRIYPRRIPRGFKRTKAGIVEDPGQDWPSRWYDAGGQFYGNGRMIARKDDPIWDVLGDATEFRDAMNTRVPPFWWGSGGGWRQVRRDECIKLGVIKEEDEVKTSAPGPLNQGVQADLSDLSPRMRKAIIDDIDVEMSAGVAKLKAKAIVARQDVEAAGKSATKEQRRAADAAEWAARYFANYGTTEGAIKGWETRRRYGLHARAQVGKFGDWKSLGLRTASELPVSAARPGRLRTPAEALAKLEHPYYKTDPLGHRIELGSVLRKHMAAKINEPGRVTFLPHAEKTIEQPVEIWRDGTDLRHIALFRNSSGKASFLVMSTQTHADAGVAVSFMPKDFRGVEKFRTGRLLYAK